MKKLESVPEVLNLMASRDWQWGTSFEAHDWLVSSVCINQVHWVADALTRASMRLYSGSWSVVIAENRDPQRLRDLAKLAGEMFKGKKSSFTISDTTKPRKPSPARRVVA